MSRTFAICSAFLCLFLGSAVAQDLMPPDQARQLGLTEAWRRPIQAPAGAQSISDQRLFVHQANPREYVEIVTTPAATASTEGESSEGKVLVRIPTDRLGIRGLPIGKKEAERLANNQLRRLKRRGIDASLSYRSVPRVHLYSVASDGTLECRDAETGEPVWMVPVGDHRLPYKAIGTNEEFLSVVNGSNLIQVEAATGEIIAEERLSGSPMFGAINAGDFAMVPMIGGAIGGYPIKDFTLDPFKEIVAGSALALPTRAPGSARVAWGTDRGFVYVIEMLGEPSVLFRLNTDGIVSGRIAAASGNRFFFGSEAGQAYGLRATRSGIVLWSEPFGEPFYDAPMVVAEQVLIRSSYGNLFSLDAETGKMTWERPIPNMGEFITAFGGQLYLTTMSGALGVVDLELGRRVGIFNQVRPTRTLVNTLTDRLYLVSESGEVQCLRPENAELPTFNVQPDTAPATDEAADAGEGGGGAPSGTDPFGGGAETDPFGAGGAGGGDPFGGGDAGADDPFGGGGGDPFGAGDGGGMDDPFGGGGDAAMDDPFGGNPFDN